MDKNGLGYPKRRFINNSRVIAKDIRATCEQRTI